MIEMYLKHKLNSSIKNNQINLAKLASDEISERQQTFEALFSTIRTFRETTTVSN